MLDVEKVIQNGLNKLLVNYIERHELLEKTHQQLIQLPSIADELNRRKNYEYLNETYSEDNTEKYYSSNFTGIKDMTENIVRDQVSCLENKLNKIEKKYDDIIPILDKLLDKITHLNNDIKELQNNSNRDIKEVVYRDNIQKSSLVKSSENENIEIHIKESEEVEEEEISVDDDDVNPLLITCSTISLKEEEKPHEPVAGEEETQKEEAEEQEEEEEAEEQEEEEEAEEQEEEEEAEEQEEEEEAEEEEAEEEKEETQEEEVEEKKIEDKVEEEEEEASVETESKEVVDEEASVETETKEIEDEDDDEEIFEIDIDDKTYCTNNDENGFIWELTEDGEQGEKVGYFKEGEPFFYAEEN
jgi:hypothetical protein